MAEDTTSDREALIAARNDLTAAHLAVALLRRKHADHPDVARLCGEVTRALTRLCREMQGMEERLAQRADREASWRQHLTVRPARTMFVSPPAQASAQHAEAHRP